MFVHIPRTAGTSIEALFGATTREGSIVVRSEFGPKHVFAADLLNLPSDYFKFTFVRNPFDRIVSYYAYRSSADAAWVPAQEKGRPFADWLRFIHRNAAHRFTRIALSNQIDLISVNGKLLVDFIGRFETLREDWARLAGRFGMPTELPVVNRADSVSRKHYSEYYDDETRRFVAEMFAADLEYFGYRFDGGWDDRAK